MEGERFLFKVVNLGSLSFDYLQLAGEITDLELEQSDIFQPLLVLNLALAQSRLQNLDLLIKQCQFIVSPDQLGPEDIPLILLITVQLFKLVVVPAHVLDNFCLHFLFHLLGGQFSA